MYQRIEPRWKAKIAHLKSSIGQLEARRAASADADEKVRLTKQCQSLKARAGWMESTIIEIIISEAQKEIQDFQKCGVDIIPHRVVMKTGFQTPDGK